MRTEVDVSRTRIDALVGVLIAVAAIFSTIGFHDRLLALGMHWRDFGFFVDRYRHLLDVPAWRHVPMNPNGNDIFGFHGIDGHPTVHHEVHASPIEYPLALLYRISGSLAAISAALLVGYLAALVYVHQRATDTLRVPVLHLSMLAMLALSPPFLFATTFDLRPFELLGPFVLALSVALASRAPLSHFVVIALLGFSAREDAAPILALGCVALHLDGRARDARALYALALGYAVVFHVVYGVWMGFEHEWSADSLGALGMVALYPALLLVPRVTERLAPIFVRHRGLGGLLVVLPFLVLMVRQVVVMGWPHHAFVSTPRWYGPCAVVWVALCGAAARTPARALRVVTASVAAVALVGAGLGVAQLIKWRRQAEERAPLWAIVRAIPDETLVLTDYRLSQLLAGHDEMLVWDRFPAYLEPTSERDRPEAHPELRRVVIERDALIVMRPGGYARFADAMHDAGETARWTRCATGRDWVVLRPETGATACPR